MKLSVNYQALIKLINECSNALSKTLSNPNVQTIVTAASASLMTGVIVDQIKENESKKTINEMEEKARLQQQAMRQHEAMIKALKTESDLSRERQDYLVELNEKLLKQIEACKDEDSNE